MRNMLKTSWRVGTRVRRAGIALAVVMLAVPGAPRRALGTQEATDWERHAAIRANIDAYSEGFARAGELSGTLLVAVEGRPIYERAFGMADYELGIANTVETRHGIASVTKLLTAVLALKLVDEGVVDLEDTLDEYVPEFPRGAEITLRHLLTHRSGIPHRVTPDGMVSTPRTAEELTKLASRVGLRFEPGTERGYSSAGYSVLAHVLEIAAETPYGTLLDAKVFRPAGAMRSEDAGGWTLIRGRSNDYLPGARGPVPARPADLSFLAGAGSVFSTPRDLLRVVLAIDERRYGDLVRREILGEEGEVAWNGQTFGYRAFVDYRARDGLAVIFAGNLQAGAIDRLRRDIPRIVAGDPVEPPLPTSPEAVLFDPAARARLAGVYQFRAGKPDSEEVLRFAPDGSFATLGSWVLVPVSEDRLHSTTDYATIVVLHDEDGTVSALRWSRDDASFDLPRVRDRP